ncbi:MAG: GTPase HflX [Clostridia bacterium]|nr:GTPase HflX [Clostridia bacterium]
MIYGNKEGVRDSLLAKLETLYDWEWDPELFVPSEMLALLAECSCSINREISVYLSRSGSVLDVSIGDTSTVGLRDIHLRRNTQRLSCVRCIHTHPGGDARLSDVDLSSLRAMRFDAMAALGVRDGKPTDIQAAFLSADEASGVKLTKLYPADRIPQRAWMDEIRLADASVRPRGAVGETGEQAERAYLIGLDDERSLEELASLAESAGAVVVGRMLQKKTRPDRATFIGSGKADELSLACQAAEADLAIFDDELSGIQLRNLEEILGGVRVLDRTALILDIFAQRAESHEGRLQVELAQMAYQLPRLTGHGVAMSRLGGGIGTRGPGESRLEMDRRRIRKRMHDLRTEIDALESQRALRRSKRKRNEVPVAALVGYTNAGKTTLLNTLCGAQAKAEDKLFATLDPLVRGMALPGGGQCLVADTVGFVSKLPHALVDAFRSTLEETLQADVLLIVSDGSSPEMLHQHDVVLGVLEELGAGDKPRIEIVNKVDRLQGGPELPGAFSISALYGEGIDALKLEIERRLGAETAGLPSWCRMTRALSSRSSMSRPPWRRQGMRPTACT